MAQLGRASALGAESRGFKSLYPDDMTAEEEYLSYWRAIERFSKKSFYCQMQVKSLERENADLKNKIDNLLAENQRLQQVAKY